MDEQLSLWGELGPADEPAASATHLRQYVAPPRPRWSDYRNKARQHCQGRCAELQIPVHARRVRTLGSERQYLCRECAAPIEAADKAAIKKARAA